MINRRTFVATTTGGLVTLAARAGAQDARPSARIGWLSPLSASTSAHIQETLRERLQSLGRVEGRNLSIELRYAEGDATRLPELAKELVRLKVDLIVAGSTPPRSPPKPRRRRSRSSW